MNGMIERIEKFNETRELVDREEVTGVCNVYTPQVYYILMLLV